MDKWDASPASRLLLNFLHHIGRCILDAPEAERSAVKAEFATLSQSEKDTLTMLFEMLKWIRNSAQRTPLVPMTSRYGNKAFRAFHEALVAQVALRQRMQGLELNGSEELADFLTLLLAHAFGNPVRLDYGTGHELAFLLFCLVLDGASRTGPRSAAFYRSLGILVISDSYLETARQLQQRFMLEPAGSHGVWGLDDCQFVPFLLGAAQLAASHKGPNPAEAVAKTVFMRSELQADFVYIDCLAYTHTLKTRANPTIPFSHHSPLLYDISLLPTWLRIYDGLGRMYLKEVLGKFPIMQHCLFHPRFFPFE